MSRLNNWFIEWKMSYYKKRRRYSEGRRTDLNYFYGGDSFLAVATYVNGNEYGMGYGLGIYSANGRNRYSTDDGFKNGLGYSEFCGSKHGYGLG